MRLRFADMSGSAQTAAQTAAETDADEPTAGDGIPVRPTFTPAARPPADAAASGDAVPGQVIPDDVAAQTPTVVEPATPGADYPDDTTDETDQAVEPADGDYDEARSPAPAAPVTGADLDQPLLSGDTELLSQWQRVQAEFVDDPQVAVAGAADLVEQAGQALVDALRQLQRQMRSSWDHSGASGTGTPGDTGADTEQLRQMMRRYRALFHQLCPPV